MTVPTFEKKLFSMCTPEVMSHISSLGDRTSFILFGIEAHVCVQQTALDLLEQGFDVHVVVDGVSSMSPLDREVALNRMEKVRMGGEAISKTIFINS
jgi:nicotinamidase-related amidase